MCVIIPVHYSRILFPIVNGNDLCKKKRRKHCSIASVLWREMRISSRSIVRCSSFESFSIDSISLICSLDENEQLFSLLKVEEMRKASRSVLQIQVDWKSTPSSNWYFFSFVTVWPHSRQWSFHSRGRRSVYLSSLLKTSEPRSFVRDVNRHDNDLGIVLEEVIHWFIRVSQCGGSSSCIW